MESKVKQLILKLLANKFPFIMDVSIEHRCQDDYPPYVDVVLLINTKYLQKKYNLTYNEYHLSMDQYGNFDYIQDAFLEVDNNLSNIIMNIDDLLYFTFKDYIISNLNQPMCIKYKPSYLC